MKIKPIITGYRNATFETLLLGFLSPVDFLILNPFIPKRSVQSTQKLTVLNPLLTCYNTLSELPLPLNRYIISVFDNLAITNWSIFVDFKSFWTFGQHQNRSQLTRIYRY